ncbi:MAG: glucose-6-phosphate dehydrogenase (NADP(+)), partial [Chloroflexi bacterium]|nr:glucose-6-phosphate dehydrogenase (NADP(+)) [Chloroflexota bacterium]
VAESIGVERRGGYYEESGALRDMVQNHMLQLLALVAMEPPAAFDANSVRDEKVKVLKALRAIPLDRAKEYAVRGQYGAGWIGGERVPAYRAEEGVSQHSSTETYVALRVAVENWRWSGTSFYLRHGKRLPRRATEIAIQFKRPPHLPFGTAASDELEPDLLVLRVQPEEGITVRVGAKLPGPTMRLRTVRMDFYYDTSFLAESPDAYERLLLDCAVGDGTLFTRADEVEAAWAYVTRLLDVWQEHQPSFPNYDAGTWGPPEADALLARDGHHWRRM